MVQRQGQGGQVGSTYQCSGRGDLCAPRGSHHHPDFAILIHNDGWTHGREWLLPCGP